ncbi:MAG TPA: DNA polymerase III subunit alpha [Puia sp.]|nr:DNA polymerase III subunit alpha [Puia sp.]
MYLCKTYFSFKYGTFSTKDLVSSGLDAGATTLALTNINATCDTWDFVQYCREAGIRPVVGAEIRNGNKLLYTLLAANNAGFRRINAFLSEHLLEKTDFPATPKGLYQRPQDGFTIYPFGSRSPEDLEDNERIGVLPEEVNRLLRTANCQTKPTSKSKSESKSFEKWVIRQPVTFRDKIHYNLHRLLRAVDRNTLLSKLTSEDLAGTNEYFVPQSDILSAFQAYPSIITNTYRLIDACSIEMTFGQDKNKKLYSASREDDRVLLEKLAREGFRLRYGNNKKARERLTKELAIIDQMGFTAYYLITWDMIRYAQSRGFYHVGRGSGANSIVAYCLKITDVDPIELELYFERFLNPHRTSPPDFDIDFSHRDRDEIIDYMMKRYGRNHAALLGMYPTFQHNAIVRELGKVFGLPKQEIDRLAERGVAGGDRIARAILQYGKLLKDFPAGLSIHPGGILISEEPLSSWCAVHLPPKGFPTALMDMFVAENIGLYKLDVLSQRGLGHIRECIELVKANRRIDIDIHDIEAFKRDPLIRRQLMQGRTIGCFYIESPAMRQLIKKLHCDNYATLVAASSIIRPGVGRSGMMHQYIFRHHNPNGFEYLHPKLKELLGSTYGVMIYQEQVIQVAHEWAGLDMADADMLRRATSAKYRGSAHLPRLKEKFFSNCAAREYPSDVTTEVWRQIESFADFSFCKAHSASYAVESYQSLYLKTHFPIEFAVAVINNFGGFYSRELYFYELMRAGARVHRPCINNSDHYTNLRGKDSWVGFIHVKGLELSTIESLLADRDRRGTYTTLADFIDRTGVAAEQLELLIRVGAFRFTGKSKKQLLWEGDYLQKKMRNHSARYGAVCEPLFREAPPNLTLPLLPDHPLDNSFDDIELLGFPVDDPFILIDDDPSRYVAAKDIGNHLGQVITVLGYHITHKPVRTVKDEMMSFGTFLDAAKDWMDTVHFPAIHARYPPRAGFYRITGTVLEEFGVHSIEVTHVEKVGLRQKSPPP